MAATSGGDAAAFPWDAAMALGFGLLGHTTASFWQLTPRELASAASAFTPPVAGPPERSALDALMRHFPDHPVT